MSRKLHFMFISRRFQNRASGSLVAHHYITKTACPELGFTVTADAAPQPTDISGAVRCLSRQMETTTDIQRTNNTTSFPGSSLFFSREEKRGPWERDCQQQLTSVYDAKCRIRMRATLVGVKVPRHCANLASY